LADLAGEGTRVVTALVRDLHGGISSRVFDAVGPASKPVQVIHDATAAITYCLVDGAIRGSLHGAGALAAEAFSDEGHDTVQARPGVAGAVAAVNGIYGDQLANRGNAFALSMAIRRHGRPVALTADSIAAAFPEATGRIAVFVHGWCLTERSWWRRPRTGEVRRPYGARLRDDLGFTPVYLRYNTGFHISQNGQSLADLLNQLQTLWPVPVDEIALVGLEAPLLAAVLDCTTAMGEVFAVGSTAARVAELLGVMRSARPYNMGRKDGLLGCRLRSLGRGTRRVKNMNKSPKERDKVFEANH